MNRTPFSADVIAAVSTPSPSGGAPGASLDPLRIVIRVSGAGALTLADAVFQPSPSSQPSWHRIPGFLRLPRLRDEPERQNAKNDATRVQIPACAYLMRAPRSYTREDLVEFHVPALAGLPEKMMETLTAAGARPAAAGEFTRRALLNGRLTPAQAEAVGALLAAESATAARLAAAKLYSITSRKRAELRENIERLLTPLEAGLDFSHEDISLLPPDRLRRDARALLRQAESLADAAKQTDFEERNQDLPHAVLWGPPNAGKSSLFNALAEKTVALTAALPHTTRDPVEHIISLRSSEMAAKFVAATIKLTDTAGLTDDLSEVPDRSNDAFSSAPASRDVRAAPAGELRLRAAAQRMTAAVMRRADIWLLCLEPQNIVACGKLWPADARPAAAAFVLTKADLVGDEEKHRAAHSSSPLKNSLAAQLNGVEIPVFFLSAKTGQGVERLRLWLCAKSEEISGGLKSVRVAESRIERSAILDASAALRRAVQAIENRMGEDATAAELRLSLQALDQADGRGLPPGLWSERLLDRIFSNFCIGK